MVNLINLLAVGEAGPVVHVSPHTLFTIGGWPITNSIFYGWLCLAAICALMVWVARRVSVHPKAGAIQFFEAGVEFVANFVEEAFEDKAKGRKYVPFFVTLFFIILLNNWLGLLPIVGETFNVHGYPLLRPLTADWNATLAMGVVTMLLVYGASIKESGGLRRYVRHFFVGNPKNPGYLFIGLIEIITDLTRVFSLSLRLFLNITIGEIVIAVFAYLGQLLVPVVGAPVAALPFTLLEVGVAALQAYIFTVLATMYLALSVNSAGHGDEDSLTEEFVPETIGAKA